MFTIQEAIELLRTQRPDAQLQSVHVSEAGGGRLELSGYTADDKPFRIVDGTIRKGEGVPYRNFPP